MTLFEKITRMIGDRNIPVPSLPSMPRFRVSLAQKNVTAIVVLTIAVSGLAVAVGLYFAVKDVASSTYDWPEPAEYQVTTAGLQTMGKKNKDYPDGTESQTLSIRLGDGARISTLRINATSLGRAGITKAFDISPASVGVTGAKAFLYVGTMTITDSSFPTFNMSESQVANLTTGMKCDGHTLAATVSPSVPEQVLSSERLSSEYLVDNSVVDRVQVFITGPSGAYVNQLILSGVRAHTGSLNLNRMRIGSLTIGSSNLIGDGSGIDSASCIIQASTEAKNITNSITDTPILVQ
jgi:hypothetical protein